MSWQQIALIASTAIFSLAAIGMAIAIAKTFITDRRYKFTIDRKIGFLVCFIGVAAACGIGLTVLPSPENPCDTAHIDANWQVVNAAQGQRATGRLVEALQELAKCHQSLASVVAPNAALQNIQLPGADLSNADFQGANLEDANLQDAVLAETQLTDTVLLGASLQQAKVINTMLPGADLREAHLEGAHLDGAHLEHAKLQSSHLEAVTLYGTQLEYAHLEAATIYTPTLTGSQLREARRQACVQFSYADGLQVATLDSLERNLFKSCQALP